MPYLALEKLHRLHDGYRKLVQAGGRQLLLLHENGKTYLINDSCPHGGASLARGIVVDDRLLCPRHRIEFSLKTGQAVNRPGCERLQFIPLMYDGNTLGIDIDHAAAIVD